MKKEKKMTLTEQQLEQIENLQDQAEMFGMDVDYETLELIPKRVIAKKWQFGEQDNWSGAPMEQELA